MDGKKSIWDYFSPTLFMCAMFLLGFVTAKFLDLLMRYKV